MALCLSPTRPKPPSPKALPSARLLSPVAASKSRAGHGEATGKDADHRDGAGFRPTESQPEDWPKLPSSRARLAAAGVATLRYDKRNWEVTNDEVAALEFAATLFMPAQRDCAKPGHLDSQAVDIIANWVKKIGARAK